MLDFVLSVPSRVFAAFAAAGVPIAASIATVAAAGVLVFIASQLRPEQPEPRHRPHALATLPIPISAPPVPAVEEPEAAFDPLDERTSLDAVEAFLESLGVADWRQPLTPFEEAAGVVSPTEDTGELVAVQ